MIDKIVFGLTKNHIEIDIYKLKNSSGSSIDIIPFGAALVSVRVPDYHGTFADVITGYDNPENYISDPFFFGGIVGRYGNRISRGKFSIGNTNYNLSINDGINHLHGGSNGFIKKLWKVLKYTEGNSPSITLSCDSPDGEEGYPGNVNMEVTYTLTEDNSIVIDYKGKTDKATLLNPTNHAYFNLSGSFGQTILDHELFIDANKFTPVDNTLIPTGQFTPVAGTPLDFTKSTPIGLRIENQYEQLKFTGGYDHNFVLNNFDGTLKKAARLFHPGSKRVLEVHTDQPGLQFYSGNFLNDNRIGKYGNKYAARTGLCLEAQVFPDAPNKPHFPQALLMPGETYKQKTVYHFSVE